MALKLNLNGTTHEVDAEPGTPLLWVIRDELKLTGTKFGCGVASCGACTVHVNGEPVRSCQTFIEDVEDAEVTTIEAVGDDKIGAAVQQAWVELDVVQCGYCQSGQVMSAVGLLSENPKPSVQRLTSTCPATPAAAPPINAFAPASSARLKFWRPDP